jgi:two-component system, OmpR family, sensor histidine kinase ArlS
MKLRNRIIISFSVAFLIVLGIALTGVYYLMSLNRKQEFLQRLKDKTTTTHRLLLDVKGIDHDILQVLDRNTINNLYDEKILLFDSAGTNIYSSVDDTRILFPQEVINDLQHGKNEITYTEGDYEVYAHVIIDKGKTFYAIGKAFDKHGKNKLTFLGWALFFIYLFVLILVIVISFYLSKQISRPLIKLTEEVNNRTILNLSKIAVPKNQDEIASLTVGFNNMMTRVEEAYTYQKNFTQHMSHELKTPIAVLISNIERTMQHKDQAQWMQSFEFQKNGLMQMASVINTLLDISKYETNPDLLFKQSMRIDEVLFECFENLELIYPEVKFNLSIDETLKDAEEMVYHGNERMLNIAFFNLIKNATEYSTDKTVFIEIKKDKNSILITFKNNGALLSETEQTKLFKHFFRGANSHEKAGIGLGLVMAHKIIDLHRGSLSYQISEDNLNCFRVIL